VRARERIRFSIFGCTSLAPKSRSWARDSRLLITSVRDSCPSGASSVEIASAKVSESGWEDESCRGWDGIVNVSIARFRDRLVDSSGWSASGWRTMRSGLEVSCAGS